MLGAFARPPGSGGRPRNTQRTPAIGAWKLWLGFARAAREAEARERTRREHEAAFEARAREAAAALLRRKQHAALSLLTSGHKRWQR